MLQVKSINCHKPGCKKCPHGFYVYMFWNENNKTRCEYIGKAGAEKTQETINRLSEKYPELILEYNDIMHDVDEKLKNNQSSLKADEHIKVNKKIILPKVLEKNIIKMVATKKDLVKFLSEQGIDLDSNKPLKEALENSLNNTYNADILIAAIKKALIDKSIKNTGVNP